jgi:hypothetical protein
MKKIALISLMLVLTLVLFPNNYAKQLSCQFIDNESNETLTGVMVSTDNDTVYSDFYGIVLLNSNIYNDSIKVSANACSYQPIDTVISNGYNIIEMRKIQ